MIKIACSAIKLNDGRLFLGKRHSDCIWLASRFTQKRPISGVQGFITTENKFVTRREAMKIAIEAGQVSKEHEGTDLFSENIY